MKSRIPSQIQQEIWQRLLAKNPRPKTTVVEVAPPAKKPAVGVRAMAKEASEQLAEMVRQGDTQGIGKLLGKGQIKINADTVQQILSRGWREAEITAIYDSLGAAIQALEPKQKQRAVYQVHSWLWAAQGGNAQPTADRIKLLEMLWTRELTPSARQWREIKRGNWGNDPKLNQWILETGIGKYPATGKEFLEGLSFDDLVGMIVYSEVRPRQVINQIDQWVPGALQKITRGRPIDVGGLAMMEQGKKRGKARQLILGLAEVGIFVRLDGYPQVGFDRGKTSEWKAGVLYQIMNTNNFGLFSLFYQEPALRARFVKDVTEHTETVYRMVYAHAEFFSALNQAGFYMGWTTESGEPFVLRMLNVREATIPSEMNQYLIEHWEKLGPKIKERSRELSEAKANTKIKAPGLATMSLTQYVSYLAREHLDRAVGAKKEQGTAPGKKRRM